MLADGLKLIGGHKLSLLLFSNCFSGSSSVDPIGFYPITMVAPDKLKCFQSFQTFKSLRFVQIRLGIKRISDEPSLT